MATVLEPNIEREPHPGGSDRAFGFAFATIFALIGTLPLIHWNSPRWWALATAVLFAALALIRPQILHPFNQRWLAFGRLLHRIVSPLIMGVVFFLVVTPTGWLMRLRGKDLLSLENRPDLSTYWIKREPAGPASESMRNQF
jgi:hypothetical protein